MKTCHTCKESKPVSEFYKRTKSSDGLQDVCKKCQDDYRRAWTEGNRDKQRAYDRVRSAVRGDGYTPEQRKAYQRAYYLKNSERIKAKAREQYQRKVSEREADS